MTLKITECPRDAMQGFHRVIPTELKIEYCNTLLKSGFDVIDIGSFVSVKAVPQMADTAEVLAGIDKPGPGTRLLTVVANERGAETACRHSNIDIIGFPFSVSETFQIRNTRQTLPEAFERLKNMLAIARSGGKELLVYLSMGFGNPYGDKWTPDITAAWCSRIAELGVTSINLSDTTGAASATDIHRVFEACKTAAPGIEPGAHLHTRPDNWQQNLQAAYESGCRKFDAALRGFGGCPFAADQLTGNLPTELLLGFADTVHESTAIKRDAFEQALQFSSVVFA